MKALKITKIDGESSLTFGDAPKPTLKPNHLIIKVYASAIQPSDIMNAQGKFPYTTFPRIPGRDFSGIVADGPDHLIGQEVYGTSGNTLAFTEDGAQAEYILVPEEAVAPKPKKLSFVEAATVGVPFTTAQMVLKKAAPKNGETVLVLGANGAVGSAVVQLAKGLGCRVLEGSRQENADVNTSKDPEFNTVDALTNGKGVDVVIDTVGQPAMTRAAVEKLARGGRLGFIAAPKSGSTELTFDMLGFYRKEKVLVGCNTLLYTVGEFAAELKTMSDEFDKGVLRVTDSAKWTQVKLADAVEAYSKAGQRGGGKFVVVME